MNGTIPPPALEGYGEFARRAVVAKQELGQRRASFLTCIPGFENSGHVIKPCVHVYCPAGSQDNDRFLVRSRELIDQFVLCGRKLEGAISSFAFGVGIKTCRDDYGVDTRG